MRAEAYALVGNLAQFGKAENLIAAGIGENSARPGHELMQAAELADQFVPGAQIKMIGVGEKDFRAELFERFLGQAFDRGLRAHGHEEGRLDGAVGRREAATSRARRISFQNVKGEIHPPSVSGEDEGPTDAADHISGPYTERNRERLRAF